MKSSQTSSDIKQILRDGKVYWSHPLDSRLWEDRLACETDYRFSLDWQRSEDCWSSPTVYD
jgi:hypothetical protein